MRSIRLSVLPSLDVSAEGDLWWSDWVLFREAGAIILYPGIISELRDELARRVASTRRDELLLSVGDVIARMHVHTSPALRVEEDVAWLAITQGRAAGEAIEERLTPVLRALTEEGRSGLADWFTGAYQRLPATAKMTRVVWQLAQVVRSQVGSQHLPTVIPPGLSATDVVNHLDLCEDVPVAVRCTDADLELGDLPDNGDAVAIMLPDTDPRIVELLPEESRSGQTLTVRSGESIKVTVGIGPVRLRTPRGWVYEIPRTTQQPITPDSMTQTDIHYQDLDLKIYEDTYGDYWVEAIGSPGRRSDPVPLKLNDPQVNERVALFRTGQTTAETLKILGKDLFTCLFSGQIAALWDRALRALDSLGRQTALRVRLDIRSTYLANLPWELMVSTRGENFTLAISPDRPVTRCAYDIEPPAKVKLPQPLRMLIVVSSPDDMPEFAVDPILTAIDTALAPHVTANSIQVKIVQHVTRAWLGEELRAARYDILHYIGHGQFDHDRDAGSLLLETLDGRASPMNGREFADLLAGAHIRLLVFSACKLAGAAQRDPQLGVASAALYAGIPAVIAMRDWITDTEAANFSRAFYRALIDGEPLETCVAYGRQSIAYAEGGGNRAGWAAPVLYSNLPDGLLFDHMPNGKRYPHRRIKSTIPSPGAALRPAVAQLPAPGYSELLYRDDELRRTIDAVAGDEPERPIVISGPPGSGSSSLALETARRCLDRSRGEPDSPRAVAGAVWVSRRRPPLSGPLPMQPVMGWGIEDLYQQLTEALPIPGLRQARLEERSELVRTALQQNRYLVVIDDFGELHGLTLKELVDRLPPPTKVIVVSHRPEPGGALGVELRELSADQAADLLRRVAVANGATGAFPEHLSVLGRASGNPLALRLLAGRLADGEDVMATAAARTELPASDQGLLRLLIRESLNRCSAAEMAALRTIALYPEPLKPMEIARALNRSEEEVVGFLTHPGRLGLVNVKDKTISLSQRIRHEALDVDQKHAEELIRRAIQNTLTMIEQNAPALEYDQPRYTDAQIHNAVWAASQAYALHDWTSVLRFRNSLHEVLFLQEFWCEGIELGKWAYDAADHLGDDEMQAWCALYPIARHHFYQADYQEARLWSERALNKFDRFGYAHGVATAKRYLGRTMDAMSSPDEAQHLFQEALASDGIHSDMKGYLIAALAELAERRADYETAQHDYQQALKIYEGIGHSSGRADAEHGLGRTALALGHHDEARKHLEQSLRLLVLHDRPRPRAEVLQSLAHLEESLAGLAKSDQEKFHQFAKARAYLLEAKKAIEALGLYTGLASIDVELTRIEAKLPPKPDGDTPLGFFGSADAARLPGDPTLELGVPLRCPVQGCNWTRITYDYWTDYWPSCPRHHVRMVEVAI